MIFLRVEARDESLSCHHDDFQSLLAPLVPIPNEVTMFQATQNELEFWYRQRIDVAVS